MKRILLFGVVSLSLFVISSNCELERNELYKYASEPSYDYDDYYGDYVIENPDGPIPGNDGIVDLNIPSQTSLSLKWNLATDGDGVTPQEQIKYSVYESYEPEMGTISEIEANGYLLDTFTNTSSYDITNFAELSVFWYYNIIAEDTDGYRNAYRGNSTNDHFQNKSLGIESFSPSDGSTQSQTEIQFTIVFDENLNTNTLTADDGSCTGSVSISNNGFASCVPLSIIEADIIEYYEYPFYTIGTLTTATTYTVRVSTAITSLSGNKLTSNEEWTYQVP